MPPPNPSKLSTFPGVVAAFAGLNITCLSQTGRDGKYEVTLNGPAGRIRVTIGDKTVDLTGKGDSRDDAAKDAWEKYAKAYPEAAAPPTPTELLAQQVAELTAQVAALTASKTDAPADPAKGKKGKKGDADDTPPADPPKTDA